MAKSAFKSVDEYIARHPPRSPGDLAARPQHHPQGRARRRGSDQLPDPHVQTARGLRGLFRGWKQRYSLYPATDHLLAAFKDDLAPYEVNKGTIRFPLSQPVPVKLIERIAKYLAKEAAERAGAKLAGPKKRR